MFVKLTYTPSLNISNPHHWKNVPLFLPETHRYKILRHPSYVGFYYWAVGTQMILCNPLSTILYGLAAWTFFRYRIAYEEETLKQHFPDGAYEAYAARTYIGIPFIRMVLRFDTEDK